MNDKLADWIISPGKDVPATLAQLHCDISFHLGQIERFFKPGYKLTLIGRHPNYEGRHVVLTNEDTDTECLAAVTSILQNGFAHPENEKAQI